uniref:Uncharacterized protein n=1 Tax=Arundo donax TaxID=35708 RepID=A0A0A8Z9Y0_ARUDO
MKHLLCGIKMESERPLSADEPMLRSCSCMHVRLDP